MNENEEILIKISVAENEVEEKIISLRQSLTGLKAEKKELEKAFAGGLLSGKQFETAMEANAKATKHYSDELKDNRKTLADYTKVQDAAEGSIEKMRAGLPLLTAEYIKLSRAQRDSASGKAMLDNIRELSDELKENERAMGDNRRNVGNYIRDLNVMGINVGQAADSFKNGAEATKIFTKSILTTRGAFVLLGAVPILLFLTGLIAFFKSTDEGADKLAQGIAYLTGGLDALAKGIAPLGKLLVDLFTSPVSTIKNLVAGTDEYKVSLEGVARAALQAAEANAAYTRQLQVVEDNENALIAQRAKVGLQVDQALLKVKDRTLSEREKIRILQEAGKAEAALAKQETINARDRLAAILQLNITRQRSRALTDDELNAQLEAEAALINAKRNSLNIQQGIANRISAQNEAATASAKANADKQKEIAKNAAQDQVYQAQLALIRAKRRGEETLALEEDILRKEAKLQSVGLGKNSTQRKLIEAQTNAAILTLRIDHAQELQRRVLDIERSQISASLAVARRGSAEVRDLQISEIRRTAKEQLSELETAFKKQVITKEQYDESLADIQNSSNRAIDDARIQFQQAEINRIAELGKIRVQTELDTTEDFLAIRRNSASKVIEIERDQQLASLALMEITEEERTDREASIIATAAAKTREVYRQIMADYRADRLASIDTQLADTRAGSDKEYQLLRKRLKIELESELANTELSEKQKEAIRAKYRRIDLDLQKSHTQAVIDKVVETLSAATTTLTSFVDASVTRQINALDDQQKAALSSTALTSDARAKLEADFQKKREKIEKEAAEKRRKIASIENVINTAAGIQKAFATSGPIVGAILAALVLAKGIATQVTIDNQKFAQGGLINGPSHAQGGVKYRVGNRSVELEGGEAVINKHSTAKYLPQLSAINQAGGGVSLMKGFNGPKFSQPISYATPKFALGGLTASVNDDAIASAVERGIARANIRVGVDEITNKQRSVRYAEASGDI